MTVVYISYVTYTHAEYEYEKAETNQARGSGDSTTQKITVKGIWELVIYCSNCQNFGHYLNTRIKDGRCIIICLSDIIMHANSVYIYK